MFLCLVKQSKPDIVNMTQELPKIINGANQTTFLNMYQVIKNVLAMRSLALKLEPKGCEKKSWDTVCFSFSDYSEDSVTRRNIIGFILYVLGVPVSLQLKAQRSSSETE